MSERLRDLGEVEDPALAELARLVRAAADLEPSPGAQQRVRARLAEPRRRRMRWPQRVLVLVLLVVVMPVVLAAVGQLVGPAPRPAVIQRVDDTTSVNPRPVRSLPSSTPPELPSGPPPELPSSPPPELPSSERAHGPELQPPAAHDRRAAPEVQVRPERATAPARAPASGEQDVARSAAPPDPIARDTASPEIAPEVARSELPHAEPAEAARVLRAFQLLRRDHDPRGALRELDGYRARFPDGDLAEESLALSIEARVELGDGAARSLAEQYLRRFPRGRFRALAEQAERRFRDR